MKRLWNRNFLLGLGCGLILSFLIVSVNSPPGGQNTAANVVPPETIKPKAQVRETAYQPVQPKASIEKAPVKEIIKEVTIEIPKGATSSKIAKLLAEKGVIPDAEQFLQVVSDYKLSNKFYPGVFNLKIDEDTLVILSTLTKKDIAKLKQ